MQNLPMKSVTLLDLRSSTITCLINSGYRVILCTVWRIQQGRMAAYEPFTWNEEITRKIEVSDGRVFSKVLERRQSHIQLKGGGSHIEMSIKLQILCP